MGTYDNIITRAISGFSDIYNVLIAKKIKKLTNNGEETTGAVISNADKIPVEDYSTLINSELFRVGERVLSDISDSLSSDGVIFDYGTLDITPDPHVSWAINPSNNKYTYTFYGNLAHGFYDGNRVNIIIEGTDKLLSYATSSNLYDSTSGDYIITPDSGTALGRATVAAGDITASVANLTKNNYSLSSGIELPSGNLEGASLNSSDYSSYVTLSVKSTGTIVGSVSGDVSTSLTEGYIRSGDVTTNSGSISLAGSVNTTTSVYIKSGTISNGQITAGSVGIAPATGENISVVSAANKDSNKTYFEIVGSATGIGATIDTTTGYITGESSKSVISSASLSDVSFFIPKGNAAVSTIINTQLVDRTDDKTGIGQNDNIFLSSAPQSGDYYTVQASASTTVTAGYLNSTDTDSATSSTYYIPKAILAFDTDNGNPVIRVSTPGYLPSGFLRDITDITGTITTSNVDAVLGSSNDIISFTTYDPQNNTDAYPLTISKASSTTAGFMSASEGGLALSGNSAIKKSTLGSVLGSPNISIATSNGQNQITKSGNNYIVSLDGSIVNTTTIEEGYIHLSDLTGFTGNQYSVSTSNNTTEIEETKSFSSNSLSLNVAGATVSSAAAAITTTSSDVTYTQVAPSQSNASHYAAIQISATNGALSVSNPAYGYFGDTNEITLSAGSNASTTLYIPTLDGSYITTTGPASGTDDLENAITNVDPGYVYSAGSIGSLSGDITESSSIAHAADPSYTVGLRDTLYVDTSGKYGLYDAKVTLSANAMGSNIVSALAALKSRLDGNITTVSE